MAPGDNGPSIVLLTLAGLLITCLIVDSVLRPPVIEASSSTAAAGHLTSAAIATNPCPTAAPCTYSVYDAVHDACMTVRAAPGTACTSPCLAESGTCAPAGCQGTPRGQCVNTADCIFALSPLAPNETEVLCVQGQCQLHVRAPFVTLEDHVLVLVATPCSTYLVDRTCIRDTSVLVPMELTRHKEPNTQYRVCQFVFNS